MRSIASLAIRAGSTRRRLFGAIVLAVCTLTANVASAAYKEMPVDPPTLRGWRKAMGSPLRSQVILMLAAQVPLNVSDFDKFFTDQLFPQFTLIKENVVLTHDELLKNNKEGGSMLPVCRREFLQQFVNAAKDKTAYDRLTQLTVKTMSDIATENYHPLSRYTAVMVLDNLHEFVDPTVLSREEPKPLAAAFPKLLACLDSIDVVKVAALNGLKRHVQAGLDADSRRRLAAALLKMVGDKTADAASTPAAHDWVRRQAIEVLTMLAQADPAANQPIAAACDAILRDGSSSIELSCAAAKALGSLKLTGLDPAATAFSIGQVAVDAYKAELARAAILHEEFTPPPTPQNGLGGAGRGNVPAPRPAAGGLGGLPGAVAPAAEEQPFISAQWLKTELTCLQQGLRGADGKGGVVAAASGTPAGQFASDLSAKLDALIDTCKGDMTDYATLANQIKTAGQPIEALLAGHPTAKGRPAAIPAAAPAATPATDFGPPEATKKPAAGKAAP